MRADVLILGGGPAGGLAALRFARAGFSVVLCEAQAVLTERVCGMYLCPAGVALLERLGLRERVAAEARVLHGMVLVAPNLERLETFFPEGEGCAGHGLSLVRPKLDNDLLELAREEGATVRMGARPVKVERAAQGWCAELAGGERVAARLLVGADGRKSATARLLGLALPVRRTRTAMHIDTRARKPVSSLGELHVFDDGAYVGLNPISDGMMNFGMACDPEALRGVSVLGFINARIERSPYLRELVEPLPPEAKPGTTFPINARVRTAAVHDAALVGDASGYIDPLTGEGIFGALWTADELVRKVSAGWSDLPSALARYARARAQRQRVKSALCEIFQQIITRPQLANGVHWLLSRKQAVADSFMGIIGNSYSPGRGFVRIAREAFVQ
jgi:2-polyprenyl-6-methoxyphenol hydroxylase-like FAD-dependent oxidoreductase